MQKRYSSSLQSHISWALLLGFLFFAMTLPAQQNTETTTQESNNWVRIEAARWTELQNLSIVLETRLMTRVEQVRNLQTLLEQSEQTIQSLESQSLRLSNQLVEISKSHDELENSLETERQASANYIDALIEQKTEARNQRDDELKRRMEAEDSRDTFKTIAGVSGGLNIILLLLLVLL